MINIPPIKQSSAVKGEVIPDITRAWKVGQVLNATTQRGGEALSNVLLRVGQLTIEAKTPIALQNGQDIKLLVKSLTENQSNNQISKLPILSIIDTQQALPETNKLAALKLRQFIAIQQSFSQLQLLSNALLNNKTSTEQLPDSLKKSLNILQHSLQLNTKNISTAQLKQQIFNSGIFLESKILKTEPFLQQDRGKTESSLINDFKYQLLTLKHELSVFSSTKGDANQQLPTAQQLNQLQSAISLINNSSSKTQLNQLTDKLVALLPKNSLIQISSLLNGKTSEITMPNELQSIARLLISTLQQHGSQQLQQLQEQLSFRLMLLDLNQQVDQSISKMTSLQLQPMSREGDNLVLLLFNLVFKDATERFDIDFRIQQETDKTDDNDESWSVTLSFNFKTLGKVQSQIHLVGTQVSSVFHTEYMSTAEKIKQLLPLLESSLTNAGLNIVNLSVENSLIESRPFVSDGVNLLDENA